MVQEKVWRANHTQQYSAVETNSLKYSKSSSAYWGHDVHVPTVPNEPAIVMS